MELSIGLSSRRLVIESLTWELARRRRYHHVMSVLLVGLDLPLDSSPAAMSQLISRIGGLVRHSLRDADMVGDYGRSELLALLPETPISGALIAAERARSFVEKRVLSPLTDEGRSPATISIGVVGYPEDGDTVALMLAAAEGALAEARALGGNRVQLAQGLPSEPATQPPK